MNREELIKLLQSWLTTATDDNGNPIHVIMDVDIHEIATEIIKSSLPPAEGAKKVQWSGYGELGNISQKPPQPTVDGAEEFLKRNHISGADFVYTTGFRNMVDLMTDFATLHAQRLAEKMVEEGLKEELIDFGHAMFPDESLQNIKHYVDTHLKSREP